MINQNHTPLTQSDQFKKIFPWLLVALFMATIALYGFSASQARLLQDDYCYFSILDQNRFFQSQAHSYTSVTTYSGNRYSLSFNMGLLDLLGGVKIYPFLPWIIILFWLTGLYFFIKTVLKLLDICLEAWKIVLISELIILFNLALTPNWIQIFYWSSGRVPYLTPTIWIGWLFFLILCPSPKTKWAHVLSLLAVFLIAFYIGGFSETVNFALITISMMVLLLSFLAPKLKYARAMTVTATVAALVSLAFLYFSPVVQMRAASLYGETSNLWVALLRSVRGGLRFFFSIVKHRPFFLLAAFVIVNLLGSFLFKGLNLSIKTKTYLKWFIISTICLLLIIIATMLPSYYAESSHPGDRALNVPTFFFVIYLCFIIFLTQIFIKDHSKARQTFVWLNIFLGLALAILWMLTKTAFHRPPDFLTFLSILGQKPWIIILVLATGLAIFLLRRKKPHLALSVATIILILAQLMTYSARQASILKERANLWDKREQEILTQKEAGMLEIQVPALDSLVGIAEIDLNPKHWVNVCAARYYEVEQINTVEPVLDVIRIEQP